MTVNTITVGPGSLTLGASGDLITASAQIRKAVVKPAVVTADNIPVLSGEEVPGDRTESFTFDGTLLQDLGAGSSLVEWCWEHRGEQHAITYIPSTAADMQISGTVVVEAVDIGGDVKTKPTSDFSFKFVGAPVIGAVP